MSGTEQLSVDLDQYMSGTGRSHSEVDSRSRRVRSNPMSGHRQTGSTGPFRTTGDIRAGLNAV
jgi:hypothetical protein